ncbi:MAG: hypothetical protein AAB263_07535 [Planctomycetota bacterium]
MTDQRAKEIVDGLGDAGGSEADQQASRQIVSALRTHRDSVSGVAAVPLKDEQLSSKIMASAKTRSQELQKSAAPSATAERPVPMWLILAWVAALAAFIVLWWKFG